MPNLPERHVPSQEHEKQKSKFEMTALWSNPNVTWEAIKEKFGFDILNPEHASYLPSRIPLGVRDDGEQVNLTWETEHDTEGHNSEVVVSVGTAGEFEEIARFPMVGGGVHKADNKEVTGSGNPLKMHY